MESLPIHLMETRELLINHSFGQMRCVLKGELDSSLDSTDCNEQTLNTYSGILHIYFISAYLVQVPYPANKIIIAKDKLRLKAALTAIDSIDNVYSPI